MTPPRPDPRTELVTPPRVDRRVEPDEKETVRVAAVPDWAREFTLAMRDGFSRVEERQQRQERTLNDLATEVLRQDSRLSKLEADRERQSLRVREVDERSSSNDLAHEANIAAIRSDVEAIRPEIADVRAKVDAVLVDVGELAGGINRIVASPKAKMIASAVVAWLLGYLASKGVSIPALQ